MSGAGLWITNHISNPFVCLLLRSPLGGRAGRRMAIIRVRGVRTGRTYELPVQYVREDEKVWIVAVNPERKTWWRNLRRESAVSIRLAGREYTGLAIAIEGSEDAPSVAAILERYLAGSPAARSALGLEEAGPSPAPDDPAIRKAVVVEVRLEKR